MAQNATPATDEQTTTELDYDDRDALDEGETATLVYENPYSGTTVEKEVVVLDTTASVTVETEEGKEWEIFGSSIRTTEDSRRASGRVDAKNGRKVGFLVSLEQDDDAENEDEQELVADGGRSPPECVLCGFLPEGPTEGLTTLPVEEVPEDARDVNDDVVETDAAPSGTVWVCDECKDETTDPHYHPVSVRETTGPTFAVAVTETFNDGSTRTEHYTEEQATELLNGLRDALDADEEDAYAYEVVYENPNGVEETATFEGSRAVEIFTSGLEQEGGSVLDVTLSANEEVEA